MEELIHCVRVGGTTRSVELRSGRVAPLRKDVSLPHDLDCIFVATTSYGDFASRVTLTPVPVGSLERGRGSVKTIKADGSAVLWNHALGHIEVPALLLQTPPKLVASTNMRMSFSAVRLRDATVAVGLWAEVGGGAVEKCFPSVARGLLALRSDSGRTHNNQLRNNNNKQEERWRRRRERGFSGELPASLAEVRARVAHAAEAHVLLQPLAWDEKGPRPLLFLYRERLSPLLPAAKTKTSALIGLELIVTAHLTNLRLVDPRAKYVTTTLRLAEPSRAASPALSCPEKELHHHPLPADSDGAEMQADDAEMQPVNTAEMQADDAELQPINADMQPVDTQIEAVETLSEDASPLLIDITIDKRDAGTQTCSSLELEGESCLGRVLDGLPSVFPLLRSEPLLRSACPALAALARSTLADQPKTSRFESYSGVKR